ncbi:MAG TPA: NAD(P)/FAD-dependent oxidoreductase [Candidatus Sulfotelmatobacter sp.]|nr:NAD(P)/FAD-dependent oxidoreductase [Candidatus Sulfotelmatobacter sp.]
MATHDKPVVIVGAGIAGLAAAAKLGQASIPAIILEARDRIGGRILTQQGGPAGYPVELGAEFIHGMPSEIWDQLQESEIEVDGQNWCASDRGLSRCSFFSQVDSILEAMDDSLPDESLLDFLQRKFPNPSHDPKLDEAKRRAIAYVSGFNAADPGLVGVHWLVAEMRAEEKTQGDRAFRSRNGYADLINAFRQQIVHYDVPIQTGTIVESIVWKPGRVQVKTLGEHGPSTLETSQVLVTLPISILKASGQPGAVEFVPPLPKGKIAALDKLEMGKVIRIVLRFRQRFWETIAVRGEKTTLSDMSFLFSEDELFPTWWTTMPEKQPQITGWAPFRSAEKLSGKDEAAIVREALQTLSRLLGVSTPNLESCFDTAYLHDWQTDPFSRGAYSYAKVGADGAQQTLGTPVSNTLFFAGEATDTSGNNGTVHGAIASAYRAAREIIEARVSAGERIA